MKQKIGLPRTNRKPLRAERRATEDTGAVPIRPPSAVLPGEEQPRRARAQYMRRYLRIHHRRERWLAKAEPDYLPFRDSAGDVLVLIGVPCAIPSTPNFRSSGVYGLPTMKPGRIYRLHWTRAASLVAGHLAELVEVSPASGQRHPPAWGWASLTPPESAPTAQRAQAGDGSPGSVQRVERLLKTLSRALPED